MNNQATKKEHVFYSLYFFGQNLLWSFAGLVSTFLLDIGIDAAVASVVLLAPKIWDAINDTLFGIIVDKTRFKNGQKFLPWIKIGTSMVAVVTILMFAIPRSIANPAFKIAWFVVAYILFDAAYTMLDAPMFAMPTVMTSSIKERTSFIAGNKLWSMVGAMLATILIPLIRPKTGWFVASIIFCCAAFACMVPFLFAAKERTEEDSSKSEEISIKDMFRYIGQNRYLLVALLCIFIMGMCCVEQTLTLIMARNCLGSESMATPVSACVAIPVIFVSAIIPKLNKKFDKFNILIAGLIFSIAAGLASYFVGYSNIVLVMILVALKCCGMAFYTVICYMFVADTVEYGTYHSGTRVAGLTFALQTFVSKLKAAFLSSVALGSLAVFGYNSAVAENATQAQSVVNGIWGVFNLLPVIGYVVSIILLVVFYKLRDRDVQAMALYNKGELNDEQELKMLEEKFGKPAKAQ